MVDMTLEQMQIALEEAGINLDPSTWDGEIINRAGKVLQEAYIRKLQRSKERRERKEREYAARNAPRGK